MEHNIERMTMKNNNYRKVVYTDKKMQLVLMSLNPGEDIPMEVHWNTTQFFRIESGKGMFIIGRKKIIVTDGDFIIVPAGKKHYVANISTKKLKLYTIYTPPEHKPNKVDKRQPKK